MRTQRASAVSVGRAPAATARLLSSLTALLLALPPLGALGHGAAPVIRVVVTASSGATTAAADAVRDVGGQVTRALPIVHGVAATVPVEDLGALERSPHVTGITPDRPVQMQSLHDAGSVASAVGSMYQTTLMTGAQAYWRAGYTGQGVDIAVIDSGVVPVNGLTATGKVLNGPDLSFESQAPTLAHLDTFGHGTHMAGIAAGRDDAAPSGAYAGDSSDFIGMAPDARIISVKVADSHGLTDVSQVLAAIDWVVEHRADPGLNIRVLNLSFGTDSYQSYAVDPLSYAVETAWHAGIVVTAAAGNAGWKTGVLDPASNPYLIAVGAVDTNGSTSYAQHTVASFSAGGDGNRNPDLAAPGIHVIGLRDPNSSIDQANPQAVVDKRLFLGSGTSQATAVLSGAAALIVSQYPQATADQVKALLTSTAMPLAGPSPALQGAGELDLSQSLTAPLPVTAAQAFAPSTGAGSLDGARGSVTLTWGGVALRGEVDIFGNPVNTTALANQLNSGTAWQSDVFNGVAWTGSGWVGGTWSTSTWTSSSWSSNPWSSNPGSSNQWSSNQWSSNQWSSNQWSSNQWSSNQWSSASWT